MKFEEYAPRNSMSEIEEDFRELISGFEDQSDWYRGDDSSPLDYFIHHNAKKVHKDPNWASRVKGGTPIFYRESDGDLEAEVRLPGSGSDTIMSVTLQYSDTGFKEDSQIVDEILNESTEESSSDYFGVNLSSENPRTQSNELIQVPIDYNQEKVSEAIKQFDELSDTLSPGITQ